MDDDKYGNENDRANFLSKKAIKLLKFDYSIKLGPMTRVKRT
jgi:hypothetical protein